MLRHKIHTARKKLTVFFAATDGALGSKSILVRKIIEKNQYRCRPNKQKDKPCIERFIGTLQTEYPDYHYEPMDVYRMQKSLTSGFLNIRTDAYTKDELLDSKTI